MKRTLLTHRSHNNVLRAACHEAPQYHNWLVVKIVVPLCVPWGLAPHSSRDRRRDRHVDNLTDDAAAEGENDK